MRLQNIILPLAALLFSSIAHAQIGSFFSPLIDRVGDSVVVTFALKVGVIPTNTMLTIQPSLITATEKYELRPLVVIGRKKAISMKRKKIDIAGTGAVIIDNSRTMKDYAISVPYDSWMDDISLVVYREIEEYDTPITLNPLVLVSAKGNNNNRYSLTPQMMYESKTKAIYLSLFLKRHKSVESLLTLSTPATEISKDKYYGDGLIVYFEQGSSIINKAYRGNKQSLLDIVAAIELIESDPNSVLKKITVTGGASPEGSEEHNKKIGKSRIDYLSSYFSKYVDANLFEVDNIGANWDGLYRLVDASDMEYRVDVLSILDTDSASEEKLERLKDLASGRPYRYMLKEFFPELRSVSCVHMFFDTNE